MTSTNNPESLFESFSDAVYRKDLEAYLNLFDQKILVFDMWQSWAYDGLPAWREMVTGWFSSLGSDRDVVTFRDKRVEIAGDLGFVTAFVRFAAVSETGEELRFLDNRLTWVIRRSGESWKIVHQHTSGPIDFNTMQVVLKKDEYLFSYGTLQQEAVQLATFNRKLSGTPETLTGYRLGQVEIKDEDVIEKSGLQYHPIISYTGNAQDIITGTAFSITHADLLAADAYEAEDYKRIEVTLASGRHAWVYIKNHD